MNKWNNGNYILLKGFAKHVSDFNTFQKNLEDSFVVNHITGGGNSIRSVALSSESPIHQFVEARRQQIESMVQKKFNFDRPVEMRQNGNLMKFRDGIVTHNDWFEINKNHHPDAIVARGILTFNPTYVFGTDVYSNWGDQFWMNCLGGYPGDLLIFKCSPDSWHSVGNKTQRHVDRYSINMMFKLKQK